MSKTVNLSKVRRQKIAARKNSIKKRANIGPTSVSSYISYLENLYKKIDIIKKTLKEIEELSDGIYGSEFRD